MRDIARLSASILFLLLALYWGAEADPVGSIDGIEIEGEYALKSINTAFRANYTLLFTLDDIDGNPLTRRPKESLNIFVDHYLTPDITVSADHFGICT